MAPVQRVEENRRSLELRNGRIPRIFRNNLAYEDDTNSQFACILRNFGLEHSFVHLQTAGSMGRLPCPGDLLRPRRPRQDAKKSPGSRPVFCSVTPLQNVRNENLLPWHRRSSYEPDAPARGSASRALARRVGLVCAKDAKLSCRGNRGSGGECVRSLPAVVAYPLPGGLGVGFPRTRFASRPQPKPRASCQNSRTLLAVPGYRTRSRRGLMPDKQENNRARGGGKGGRRIRPPDLGTGQVEGRTSYLLAEMRFGKSSSERTK